MIHARKDYQRIQDPALTDPSLLGEGCSPIGEDEPVFLLRAQDVLFLPMLRYYRELTSSVLDMAESSKMRQAVTEQIERAQEWQKTHTPKAPDLPKQQHPKHKKGPLHIIGKP